MEQTFVKISDIAKNQNFHLYESPIETKLSGALEAWGVKVVAQKKIGNYRADLFIEMDGKKIVVECDGKEFHSSSEQRAHDKERDDFMERAGLLVLRFTGKEITSNLQACVIRIIEELSSIYQTERFQSYIVDWMEKQGHVCPLGGVLEEEKTEGGVWIQCTKCNYYRFEEREPDCRCQDHCTC